MHFKPEEKVTVAPGKITEEVLSNFLENPFRKELKEIEENDDEDYKAILSGVEIGTEATRTGIIKNAIKIGYISRKKDVFSIEEKGIKFIETLDLLGIDLYKEKTVEFSKLLKQIFQGNKTVEEALERAKQELNNIFSKEVEIEKYNSDIEVIGKCPKCGGAIYEGGENYYCSGYKQGCKFTLWKESKYFDQILKITKEKAKKLLKGEKTKFKLKSQKGNEYEAYFTIELNDSFVSFKKGDFAKNKKNYKI